MQKDSWDLYKVCKDYLEDNANNWASKGEKISQDEKKEGRLAEVQRKKDEWWKRLLKMIKYNIKHWKMGFLKIIWDKNILTSLPENMLLRTLFALDTLDSDGVLPSSLIGTTLVTPTTFLLICLASAVFCLELLQLDFNNCHIFIITK